MRRNVNAQRSLVHSFQYKMYINSQQHSVQVTRLSPYSIHSLRVGSETAIKRQRDHGANTTNISIKAARVSTGKAHLWLAASLPCAVLRPRTIAGPGGEGGNTAYAHLLGGQREDTHGSDDPLPPSIVAAFQRHGTIPSSASRYFRGYRTASTMRLPDIHAQQHFEKLVIMLTVP